MHDCALQKLPVVIMLDRAGVSGRDGRTHHGIYDIAFLNSVPDISVCAPCCTEELKQMLAISNESYINGPFIIRYPAKDSFDGDIDTIKNNPVEFGKGCLILEKKFRSNEKNVLFVTFGQITGNCIKAAEAISDMCNVAVFNARFLKPLDENGILECIKEFSPDVIITAEDGVSEGGFGASVAVLLQKNGITAKFDMVSAPKMPIDHGSIEELYEQAGMDSVGIMKKVLRAI